MCTEEEMNGATYIFFNEFRFFLHSDNRRIFIWRECGTRNNPMLLHENGGGGVMVSIDGRTDLHIIQNGTLIGRLI